MLGLYFSSDVREKQGLCYYIVSSLYRYKEYIVVESAINYEEKDNVINSVKEALEKFSPTSEEIARAKRYIVSSLKPLEIVRQELWILKLVRF